MIRAGSHLDRLPLAVVLRSVRRSHYDNLVVVQIRVILSVGEEQTSLGVRPRAPEIWGGKARF